MERLSVFILLHEAAITHEACGTSSCGVGSCYLETLATQLGLYLQDIPVPSGALTFSWEN